VQKSVKTSSWTPTIVQIFGWPRVVPASAASSGEGGEHARALVIADAIEAARPEVGVELWHNLEFTNPLSRLQEGKPHKSSKFASMNLVLLIFLVSWRI
jgi:hypothetical protein